MNEFQLNIPASVQQACPHGALPGRLFFSNRGHYSLYSLNGEAEATLSGNLRYAAASTADLPVVGDWVFVEEAVITGVAPRWSKFSRRSAGSRNQEQVLAANIDIAFLVCGLDRDFNLRRLERYLVLARESF